jgi:hypothetical protein
LAKAFRVLEMLGCSIVITPPQVEP